MVSCPLTGLIPILSYGAMAVWHPAPDGQIIGLLELLKGAAQIATTPSTQLSQLLKEGVHEAELDGLEALGRCLLEVVEDARQGPAPAIPVNVRGGFPPSMSGASINVRGLNQCARLSPIDSTQSQWPKPKW
jgi:hypothetical protein